MQGANAVGLQARARAHSNIVLCAVVAAAAYAPGRALDCYGRRPAGKATMIKEEQGRYMTVFSGSCAVILHGRTSKPMQLLHVEQHWELSGWQNLSEYKR